MTGIGRYTADMSRAAACEVSLCRPHARPHRPDRLVSGTRAPGRARRAHARGRARRPLRRGGQGSPAVHEDTVRFEADILAGVAALTPELAEEAARLIEVEYEELLPITDIEAALAPDAARPRAVGVLRGRGAGPQRERARLLDDRQGRRRHGHCRRRRRRARPVRDRCLAGRPIEPRAIIAQWQGDRVTVWTSTQVPFAARSGVAHVLRIPESKVRIIVRSSSAASARSATSTSRAMSPLSPARPAGRSSSSSRAARSSSRPPTGARGW